MFYKSVFANRELKSLKPWGKRFSPNVRAAPPGLGILLGPLPRIPYRFAGLHPGLLSRRADGACAFVACDIFASGN